MLKRGATISKFTNASLQRNDRATLRKKFASAYTGFDDDDMAKIDAWAKNETLALSLLGQEGRPCVVGNKKVQHTVFNYFFSSYFK